jgi:hypothetical protein
MFYDVHYHHQHTCAQAEEAEPFFALFTPFIQQQQGSA